MHCNFLAEVLMVFLSIEMWSERIIFGNTFQLLFWFLIELVDKDEGYVGTLIEGTGNNAKVTPAKLFLTAIHNFVREPEGSPALHLLPLCVLGLSSLVVEIFVRFVRFVRFVKVGIVGIMKTCCKGLGSGLDGCEPLSGLNLKYCSWSTAVKMTSFLRLLFSAEF